MPEPAADSLCQSTPLPGDRKPALAIGVVFATIFAVYGVYAPYFPVWLQSRHLSPAEIAFTLSLPPLFRPLITPLLGRLADQRADRRGLIVALVSVTLTVALALQWLDDPAVVMILAPVLMLAYQPIQPIADATVGSLVRNGVVRSYGRLRLWGSVSFAVMAVLAGFVLSARGIEAVYWLFVALLVIAAASAVVLPSAGGEARRALHTPFLVWKRPALALVLTAVALINASQAMFFAFGSVHMLRLGYPEWSVGLLWTVAVAAEVVVLWFAPTVLQRLGPYRLLLLAALMTCLRWLGMGFDPPMIVNGVLQLLHAGTLSCTILALMAFVQRLVEDEASARAQSASVTITGLMMAAMTALTGPLYQSFGGGAYFAAAILPALAAALLLGPGRRFGLNQ